MSLHDVAVREVLRRRTSIAVAGIVAVMALAGACAPPPSPPAPTATDPITSGHRGVLGDASARGASTSADGRWTAFSSAATNLVAHDTNDADDAFLRDNVTGRVIRFAERVVDVPLVNRTGRYVGFKQATGGYQARYGVYDREAGTSTTWDADPNLNVPAVTDGGEYAVHGAGNALGLFTPYCRIRDLTAATTQDCPHPSADYGTVGLSGVSGNGRHVMYHWHDQSGGTTSGYFLHDVLGGTVTPLTGTYVSLGISNVVSDDGTTIVASGFGASFPPMVHDVASGAASPLPVEPDGTVVPVGLSPDGRYAAFAADATNMVADDTNDAVDVFVLDLLTNELDRVSTALDTGAQLEFGGWLCGRAVGQVTDDGRVCIYGLDEISPTDSNGFPDAYLTAPR